MATNLLVSEAGLRGKKGKVNKAVKVLEVMGLLSAGGRDKDTDRVLTKATKPFIPLLLPSTPTATPISQRLTDGKPCRNSHFKGTEMIASRSFIPRLKYDLKM